MPLPLLVAGLAAAVVATVAAVALSDDDKPSNSRRSGENDDEERRIKEAAEKERKERERAERMQAVNDEFQKQGRAFGKSLAHALPAGLVQASLRNAGSLDFDLNKGSMKFDMEQALQRNAQLFATAEALESILTKRASHQKTIENLAIFFELYKPSFQYGAELQKHQGEAKRLDRDIEKLVQIRRQLAKLETELTSAQP